MRDAITVLMLLCEVATVFFILCLVGSLFSKEVNGQIRRHPIIHTLWGCLALIGLFSFFSGPEPSAWLPASVEPNGQRKRLLSRIEPVGGWQALQKDCDALVEAHRESGFYWSRGPTNALPPTLAALHPWSIKFRPPATGFSEESQVAVVQIKVFGSHSTGGHSTPYFGLEVVSGPGGKV